MSFGVEGWKRLSIGELCELINGRAFKPSDWTDTGLPIVRIQNLNNTDAKYNRFNGEVRERFLIHSGALLFAWPGTPGTSFGAHIWSGGRAVLNQHIFNILFDEKQVDKFFLRLAINQKLAELIDKAHGGVGLRHVTKGKFEETTIDLPPLDEQRHLVTKIDIFLSASKTAREDLARISKLVERYKQSVLATAFRGDLTAAWRVEKDLSLEKSWADATVGDLAVDVRYGTAAKCHYEPKATPVLRIPNVSAGKIDVTDVKYGQFDANEIKKLALRKGDLLVIRSNGSVDLVGRAAIVDPQAVGFLFAGYLIRIRLDEVRVLPAFVALAFEEPSIRDTIERFARSTSGVNNINSEQLRSLRIPLPSLREQEEIIHRVHSALSQMHSLLSNTNRAEELLDRLDQAILAKAFRGELAVPAAAE